MCKRPWVSGDAVAWLGVRLYRAVPVECIAPLTKTITFWAVHYTTQGENDLHVTGGRPVQPRTTVNMDTAVLVVEEQVVYRVYVPVVQRADPVAQFAKLSYGEQFGKLFYVLAVVVGFGWKRKGNKVRSLLS